MKREHMPYDPEPKTMSFAEGLMAMGEKQIYLKVNLTKRRARAVQYLCDQMVYCVPEFETPEDENDYYAAIQWIRNQIEKRYSQFGLCERDKRCKSK